MWTWLGYRFYHDGNAMILGNSLPWEHDHGHHETPDFFDNVALVKTDDGDLQLVMKEVETHHEDDEGEHH